MLIQITNYDTNWGGVDEVYFLKKDRTSTDVFGRLTAACFLLYA